jgi:hypothetical protein
MSPCSVAAVSGIPNSVGHSVFGQENAVFLAEAHQRSLYDAEDGDPQRDGGLTLTLRKTAYLLKRKPGRSLSVETNVKTPHLFGGENEVQKYEFENQEEQIGGNAYPRH